MLRSRAGQWVSRPRHASPATVRPIESGFSAAQLRYGPSVAQKHPSSASTRAYPVSDAGSWRRKRCSPSSHQKVSSSRVDCKSKNAERSRGEARPTLTTTPRSPRSSNSVASIRLSCPSLIHAATKPFVILTTCTSRPFPVTRAERRRTRHCASLGRDTSMIAPSTVRASSSAATMAMWPASSIAVPNCRKCDGRSRMESTAPSPVNRYILNPSRFEKSAIRPSGRRSAAI